MVVRRPTGHIFTTLLRPLWDRRLRKGIQTYIYIYIYIYMHICVGLYFVIVLLMHVGVHASLGERDLGDRESELWRREWG